jgi:hypothetical protein
LATFTTPPKPQWPQKPKHPFSSGCTQQTFPQTEDLAAVFVACWKTNAPSDSGVIAAPGGRFMGQFYDGEGGLLGHKRLLTGMMLIFSGSRVSQSLRRLKLGRLPCRSGCPGVEHKAPCASKGFFSSANDFFFASKAPSCVNFNSYSAKLIVLYSIASQF